MTVTGCGKFDYVAELAWQFKCADFDDDGEYYEYPHYTCFLDEHAAARALQETGLAEREKEFYKQNSIIPVLEAYGLDKEKFWYATVYIALLTKIWSGQKSLKPLPSALEQLTTLRDELKNCHEIRVVIDNPSESHSLILAGNRLLHDLLVPALDGLIDNERHSTYASAREVSLWRDREEYKMTEKTWYAANLFKILFNCFSLPVIRSRKDSSISYDKDQLIAELIHFLGLTNNDNLDGNSIRSILKSDREFKLDIF